MRPTRTSTLAIVAVVCAVACWLLLRLWADEGYRWLQVFTGDPLGPELRRKTLAVEPMTCPPNAFVTGDDLLVLEPGEAVTHTWGLQVT